MVKSKGARYRSELLKSIAFAGYNSHYPKSEGANAWLTRDAEVVKAHDADPLSTFTFTVSAYLDLFKMLQQCNRKEWFSVYPKPLPTLILSGDEDPVGKYGKGPKFVYKHLLMEGGEKLTLKIYSEARHELFLETNRQEVFSYLASWLKENI